MREATARDFTAHRGNSDCCRRTAGERSASRTASWQTFGPTLDVRDIKAGLSDGGELSVKRVTLALDVWQSLLHMRWQFRDLTFWQLQVHTNTPIQTNNSGEGLKTDRISDLFLRQFDHFTLRDSHLSGRTA